MNTLKDYLIAIQRLKNSHTSPIIAFLTKVTKKAQKKAPPFQAELHNMNY